MIKIIQFVFMALLMISVADVWAQKENIMMGKHIRQLKPKAIDHYEAGAKYLDKVNEKKAIKEFELAAQLDTDHIPIRFLLAKLCAQRAELKSGVEAMNCLDKAQNALKEILEEKKILIEDIKRANNELAIVEYNKANLAQRDERRAEVGYKIIQERFAEIYPELTEEGKKNKQEQRKKSAMKAAAKKKLETELGSVDGSDYYGGGGGGYY